MVDAVRTTSLAGRIAGATILALLGLAALVPPLRLPTFLLLLLGLAGSSRLPDLRWPVAAAIPVALNLAWGSVPGGRAGPALSDCADPLSPPAIWRLGEAIAVVGATVLLARWLGTPLSALGLRGPRRWETVLGLAALVALPVAGLVIGVWLARPFFGELRLATGDPAALLPALILAVSNGAMEEVVYRGALMAWMAPVVGVRAALIGQALVFGAAHAGPDYVASAVPVVLVVAAAGLVAGLIARRTGSLALPIAVHVALDVPLYYAAACRLA